MRWTTALVALLLAAFAAELLCSVHGQTQTFDESAHLYAGYSYWKRADFGVNPEHPPLVKLVAALPLLPTQIPVQPAPNIWFRAASGAGGNAFLYSHDAGALLFRARAAASIFALALGLFVFFAGREMFSPGAGLLALTILILEPVILAHGALVTTDVGLTACMFGAVYFFYRFVRRPSLVRLVVCGLTTGLTLAAKHSGLIVLLLLVVLAGLELFLRCGGDVNENSSGAAVPPLTVLRMAGALTAIAAISFFVLWSFYGFRYAARPSNGQLIPPTAVFLQSLDSNTPGIGPGQGVHRPAQALVIGFLEHHRLLPEAYLYGLTDIVILTQQGRTSFVLGKLYPTGRWFFFPVAFAVKTSLALLVLLILLIWVKDLRRVEYRRAVLFMAFPALIYFAVAVNSKLEVGIRHVLPIYPFLIVLAGFGAWSLAHRSRRWACAVIIILIFGAVSSLRAFPNYLPYSNELWGGSSHTHEFLSDSDVGWSSGLKTVYQYVAEHHLTRCWFAYDGPVDPAYYHIPCAPLPTFFSSIMRPRQQPAVPEEIQGPVLISSEVLVGSDFGPGRMNPYEQFIHLRPSAVLQGEVFVFDGSIHVPRAAALSHFILARGLANSGNTDQAILEAKAAEALDPDFRSTHELLASLYYERKQTDLARAEYDASVQIYRTIEPDFQQLSGLPQNPFSSRE